MMSGAAHQSLPDAAVTAKNGPRTGERPGPGSRPRGDPPLGLVKSLEDLPVRRHELTSIVQIIYQNGLWPLIGLPPKLKKPFKKQSTDKYWD